MILRNSSGDVMRWAPDQCDEIVSRLQAAREWHGPTVASASSLKAEWFGLQLLKQRGYKSQRSNK